MPSIFAQTRLILNTSTTAGQIATIPVSNDHTDGTWQVTDVYPGELFVNYTDGTISFRTVNGIKMLQVVQRSDQQVYSVSVSIPSGSVALINTVPYPIVPAPSQGGIEVISATIKFAPGSAVYPAGGTLNLVSGANLNTNYSQMQLPASLLGTLPAVGTVYQRLQGYTAGGSTVNVIPGAGIYLWGSASQAGGGNGVLTVNVLYRIINV